mmetsp:Transcript_24308/g.67717  ORF Transcript_24308/g.67717 Transcript_24308/m.67717 type:complete len:107 (+) Transcript_24308:350-670(+)
MNIPTISRKIGLNRIVSALQPLPVHFPTLLCIFVISRALLLYSTCNPLDLIEYLHRVGNSCLTSDRTKAPLNVGKVDDSSEDVPPVSAAANTSSVLFLRCGWIVSK